MKKHTRKSSSFLRLVGVLILGAVLLPLVPMNVVAAQTPDEAAPRFEPATCPADLAQLPDFACGFLVVPEDHHQPSGKTIRLMVAIARSTTSAPEPDPVLILAGGPGGGAIGDHGTSALASRIREHRAIIYLDQRGTGYSQPSLKCPELAQVFSDAGDEAAQILEVYVAQIRLCRDRLLAEEVNLKAYTSAQSAADIDALRRLLGYEQVNLLGTSYGTRLGLTVIRDFPQGVRSAVLDSVYPPTVDIYRDTPANADRVFRVLFDRCASDLLCNALYPNLRTAFLETYERLKREPAIITYTDPDTQKLVNFAVNGDMFAAGVFELLYDPIGLRLLPSLIYAVRDHDYDILKHAATARSGAVDSVSYGMFFSVQCSEEAAFSTAAEVRTAVEAYPEPLRLKDSIFSARVHSFCAEWPIAPVDKLENAPVTGNTPVLILAGEHDPVTPPEWGRLSAQTLPNSFFYQFPGMGHAVLQTHACPRLIAVEFLDDPQHAPDSTCINDMASVAFVITAPATRPIAHGAMALLGIASCIVMVSGLRLALLEHRQFAWRIIPRLITWLPILIASIVTVTVLVGTQANPTDKLRLVELAIPAALAIHAALALAPGDDRTLEVLIACPRRVMWLPLERIAMPFALSIVVALGSSLLAVIITGEQDVLLTLLRWLPPALLFMGIGIFVTVRTRHMIFGALCTLLVWGGTALIGDALLPGQPTIFPLNYIQPFFWIFHPYLQPDTLTASDYLVNRLVVASIGMLFIAWAVWHMRDTERLLFGSSSQRNRK
jgi:pimeloyl-ACP methyl ester carboxylesterase